MRSKLQNGLRRIRSELVGWPLYSSIQATFDETCPADQEVLETLFNEEVKDDKRREELLAGLAEYRRVRIPGTEVRRAVPPGSPQIP